jgi:intracellular multiplication protein IcmE
MAVQKEFKRQYGIAIGAIVLLGLVVAYLLYGWLSSKTTAPTELAPVAPVGNGQKTSESQHYSAILQDYNNKNAAKAEKTNSTYLAALSTAEQPVKPTEEHPKAQSGSSQLATAQPTVPPPTYVAPVSYSGGRTLSQQDMESIQGLLKQWAGGSITEAKLADVDGAYAKSFSGPLTTSSNESQGAVAAAAAKAELDTRVIVAPYTLTFGRLLTQLDTDEASIVRAVIPDGQPYGGARLYAPGYKRLNNDVDLTFDAMVYQGKSYKITAKPLDLDTSRTSLSGDVHHHYFARIVLPAIANGIGATGQQFAQAGQQSIVTPQGGVITTSPESPSGRNIAGTFVGGIGQSASQVLTQEAAQIPVKQTIVPKDEIIGIQFIGAVLASDEMVNGRTTGNQQGLAASNQGPASAAGEQPGATAAATPAQSAVPIPIQPRLPAGLRYTPPGALSGTYPAQ